MRADDVSLFGKLLEPLDYPRRALWRGLSGLAEGDPAAAIPLGAGALTGLMTALAGPGFRAAAPLVGATFGGIGEAIGEKIDPKRFYDPDAGVLLNTLGDPLLWMGAAGAGVGAGKATGKYLRGLEEAQAAEREALLESQAAKELQGPRMGILAMRPQDYELNRMLDLRRAQKAEAAIPTAELAETIPGSGGARAAMPAHQAEMPAQGWMTSPAAETPIQGWLGSPTAHRADLEGWLSNPQAELSQAMPTSGPEMPPATLSDYLARLLTAGGQRRQAAPSIAGVGPSSFDLERAALMRGARRGEIGIVQPSSLRERLRAALEQQKLAESQEIALAARETPPAAAQAIAQAPAAEAAPAAVAETVTITRKGKKQRPADLEAAADQILAEAEARRQPMAEPERVSKRAGKALKMNKIQGFLGDIASANVNEVAPVLGAVRKIAAMGPGPEMKAAVMETLEQVLPRISNRADFQEMLRSRVLDILG